MDKTNRIGVGIIGCGSRIKDLFQYYPDIFKSIKIIAINDINKIAVKDYLNRFGNDIKVYDDYKNLIKDPEVKWVFIGSINSAHKDQLIESFKNNKNVFCEKPLAISIEECKEIIKVANKELNFFIGYVLRYAPVYKKIKGIVENNKIGKIISMEFNETIPFNHGAFIMTDWRRFFKNSGGFLLEKCCHDIDIANWITNSIPERVASFGGLNFFIKENTHIYEELKLKDKIKFNEHEITVSPFLTDKDIIDNQVAIIEYKNKVRAVFHANCNSGIPERRIYICGEKGTIRADLLKGIIELSLIDFPKNKTEIIDFKEKEEHGGGDYFFMKDLEDCILKKEYKNFMDEAIKSAITCLLIDKSMKERKIIECDEIWKTLNIKG